MDRESDRMSSKTERARELALQGKSKVEIMELVPCSRTTAFNALKWAERQIKEKVAPKPPGVEVIEKPAKPEFVPEAPPEVPEEVIPEIPEVAPPEIPIEVNVKDVINFFDAMFGKDTWGDDYGMDKGKCESLARLWYPVFIKHWETIVETWGLEIMALVGTLFIVGGHVRSVRRKQSERKRKAKPE